MSRRKSKFWLILASALIFSAPLISENNLKYSFRFWKKLAGEISELSTLSKIAYYVDEEYVDKSKVNPQQMFVNSLKEVEKIIPEVRVRKEGLHNYKLKLNRGEMDFDLNSIERIDQLADQIASAYSFIRENTTEDLEAGDIEVAAINGVLKDLDPHTIFLPKEIFSEINMKTTGKFGGLGIVITLKDGALTVISAIEDTPAARARIMSGDKIVKINNESTVNMTLVEAVELMRGDPGTKVTIWIKNNSLPEAVPKTLMRAIINIKSVDSKMLDGGVGLIRLKHFQSNTIQELETNLRRLRRLPSFKGIILDLRNNPGGLLDQAVIPIFNARAV
jgi:carboxyl-terminal processing protease